MKKLAFWTAGGLSMATACGLAGLSHLSATLVTLTVFCTLQVLAVWSFGVVWSVPDRIATWVQLPCSKTLGGKREGGA